MKDESSQRRLRCPRCGRSRTYAELGGTRIGATSKGKRILGWCRQCRWFRWAIVERVPPPEDSLNSPQSNL